jgi:hypothetical protein
MNAFMGSNNESFVLGLRGGVGLKDTPLLLLCMGDACHEEGGVLDLEQYEIRRVRAIIMHIISFCTSMTISRSSILVILIGKLMSSICTGA